MVSPVCEQTRKWAQWGRGQRAHLTTKINPPSCESEMPETGVDGVRVLSHLSRRELVCLGHEKLLEPEEREGPGWERAWLKPREELVPCQRHTKDLTTLVVSLWCPPWEMKGPHLLLLVHHSLAVGVKHSEGTQDGFLRVSPWGGWGGSQVKLTCPAALGPTQGELRVQGSSLVLGSGGLRLHQINKDMMG